MGPDQSGGSPSCNEIHQLLSTGALSCLLNSRRSLLQSQEYAASQAAHAYGPQSTGSGGQVRTVERGWSPGPLRPQHRL